MKEPVGQAWLSALRLFCEWLADLKADIDNMMPTEIDLEDAEDADR